MPNHILTLASVNAVELKSAKAFKTAVERKSPVTLKYSSDEWEAAHRRAKMLMDKNIAVEICFEEEDSSSNDNGDDEYVIFMQVCSPEGRVFEPGRARSSEKAENAARRQLNLS